MDGSSNKDEEACPQLLDLIPKDRSEWPVQQRGHEKRSYGPSDQEKKLELRLGPPGEDWSGSRERDDSVLSLGHFFKQNTNTCGAKRGFTVENGWMVNNSVGGQTQKFSLSENPVRNSLSSPWSCSSSGYQVKAQQHQQQSKKVDMQIAEKKKAFSTVPTNTAVPNSSQKRTAPAPVVGWPPIRSFRKNLASSSSSKPTPESPNVIPNKDLSEKPTESCRKGLFVKINMDGVPIGRKVDLKAYNSYEKLSSAVDELFRGLLAAQRDTSAGGIQNKEEGEKAITGLLDGSGEYTLVYEDNEGDRVLVGDVPWHMFVSTVKRLRVLKTSELSTLCFGSKQQKIPLDAMPK